MFKKIIIGILILPLIFIVNVEGKKINQRYNKIISIIEDDIEVISTKNKLNEINKDINSSSFRVNKLNVYMKSNLEYKVNNTSFELLTSGKYKNDITLRFELNQSIASNDNSFRIEGNKVIFPRFKDEEIKYLQLNLDKQLKKEKLKNLKYKKFIQTLKELAKYIQIKEKYNLCSKRYNINKLVSSRKMKSNKIVGSNNKRLELKLEKSKLELLKIDKQLSSISENTRKLIKQNSLQYFKGNLFSKEELKYYALKNLFFNKEKIIDYKKELYNLQKTNNNKKKLPRVKVTNYYQNQPKDAQLKLEISLTNSNYNIKLENDKLKNKLKLISKQKFDYIENLSEEILLLKKKIKIYIGELNILYKEKGLLEKELIKLKQHVQKGYNNEYEIKLKEIDIRLKKNEILYIENLIDVLTVEKSVLLTKITGIKEDFNKTNLSN
ncbi:MAG: hypothetical protein U5K53_02230 [Halanaerobiales bacterium]|nr:hypothetical protein [Halanaerobiales bacterium]